MRSAFGIEHEPISKSSGTAVGSSMSRMITNAFRRAPKKGEGITLQVPDNIPGFKTLEPTPVSSLPKRPTMPEAKIDDTSRAVQQEIDMRTGEALRAPTVNTQQLHRPPAQAAPAAPAEAAAPKDDKGKISGKYLALAGILGASGAGAGGYAYDKKRRANKGA